MNFKEALSHMHDGLGLLAAHASQLENQNLADVIKAGAARVAQAMEHPDAEVLPPIVTPGEPDPLKEPPPFIPPAQ